jgi:hypothetical protein
MNTGCGRAYKSTDQMKLEKDRNHPLARNHVSGPIPNHWVGVTTTKSLILGRNPEGNKELAKMNANSFGKWHRMTT